jgi:hypothetical protein
LQGESTIRSLETFYTEIPSAYLLAGLSLECLLGSFQPHTQVEKLKNIKIGDLACGSGTLLTSTLHTIDRIASTLKLYDGEDIDVDALIQKTVEEGIYGADALPYAAQITAINLALMSSKNLARQNVYSVHLGFVKSMNLAWLGSLELLKDGEKFLGLLAWIEGGQQGAVERHSNEGENDGITLPTKFDVITMNPPFTRATGRSRKLEAGRNSFFGFIADEWAREKVKKSYETIREKVRTELVGIAEESREFPNYVNNIIRRRNSDLEQYLGVGQAGEGLIFLYMAYKFIKDSGVISFVLPKSVLSGVHWFLARTLLASKFHVKYIVASGDPNGYNFSESTSLSEVLIVAKRTKEHNEQEETTFVNLLRKPRSSLDSIVLMDKIKDAMIKGTPFVYGAEGVVAVLNRVRRDKLLENVDNWNRILAVSDVELSNEILTLIAEEQIQIKDQRIPVKLTKFTDLIKTIGINRRGYMIEAFGLPVQGAKVDCSKLTLKVPGSYPMLCGGGGDLRKHMSVNANTFVLPAMKLADKIIPLMSRLIIPYRIRWNTARVIAMCSEKPILSNMFFMTRLNVPSIRLSISEKALTVWLNSVWGVLIILANREETEGAFTGLNIGNWRLLPVLDVGSANETILKRLSKIFDDMGKTEFPRVPEQFSEDESTVAPARLELDLRVLSALQPKISRELAKKELLTLYGRIHQALESWIEGTDELAADQGQRQSLEREE